MAWASLVVFVLTLGLSGFLMLGVIVAGATGPPSSELTSMLNWTRGVFFVGSFVSVALFLGRYTISHPEPKPPTQ